jgi:hypothetical protein
MTPGTLPFAEGNERAGLRPKLHDLRHATKRQDLSETFIVKKSFPSARNGARSCFLTRTSTTVSANLFRALLDDRSWLDIC